MIDDPITPLKRQLADAILELAAETNMHVAARRFGIGVARMSELRHGRIDLFSVERLIRILATVDRPVTLRIEPGPSRIVWFPAVRAQMEARRDRSRKRRFPDPATEG